MNPKIKDIALQAGGSHYPNVGGALLEQFATLIIKECIDAVTSTDRHGANTTYDIGLIESTVEKCASNILRRFEL